MPSLGLLQISAQDLRLTIMAIVLTVMALVFHVLTGSFLTPENLYNIAQQTAVVGIVSAAIALIIVARQIDLSVGSVMGCDGVRTAFRCAPRGWMPRSRSASRCSCSCSSRPCARTSCRARRSRRASRCRS